MPYHARTMSDLLFLWHCKEKKNPKTLQIRDISHSICTLMSHSLIKIYHIKQLSIVVSNPYVIIMGHLAAGMFQYENY